MTTAKAELDQRKESLFKEKQNIQYLQGVFSINKLFHLKNCKWKRYISKGATGIYGPTKIVCNI